MRIGIFSGSFDPIHCGHAMLANYVSQFSGLDEVWLMPSPLNPLKSGSKPADFNDRLLMCRIVADKCSRLVASGFEGSLALPTYTYNTLCELKKAYPQHDFKLIIGSDNWLIFDRWKDNEKIIDEFGVIVYQRPDFPVKEPLPRNVVLLTDTPQALISSSFIRECIRKDIDLNYFLDPDVLQYILKNHLYL